MNMYREHVRFGSAVFVIAAITFTGLSAAHAETVDAGIIDPCTIGVMPPAGGFSVNNLSGYEVTDPTLHMQMAAGGDATYAEVSNYPDFSQSAFFNYGYPYDDKFDWTILPGYGVKDFYVRYVNSCKAMPGPTVIVEVKYVNLACSLNVTAPAGGFRVTSLSGSTVTTPKIVLGLAGGNAAYVEVANNARFLGSTILPYAASINWTLPSFGYKTIYVRYLNSCQAAPTAPVSVTVNYVNVCAIGITPPPHGFMVTNLSGNNVTNPNVKLGMFGGSASFMEVSNNANFSGSVMYPYASTLNWILPSGYGSKTVWVRYWNSCKTISSIAVSISINYIKR